MGIFSGLFGGGKPRIPPENWARFALDQLFSEQWDQLRKKFYTQMKKHILRMSLVSEQSFLAEMLGAQLELLCLVSVHTNRNLGMKVIVLVQEYLRRLPLAIQESVNEAYDYCNKKVAEYGVRRISGYNAIANACAERLDLKASSDFVQRLEAEFTALGETWRMDVGQYRFS